MRQQQEYIALLGGEPHELGEEHVYGKEIKSPAHSSNDRLVFLATLCVACATALSIAVFVISAYKNPVSSVLSSTSIVSTHRPNSYLHLDRVLGNVSLSAATIVNFPPTALQFDHEDPTRRMHEDARDTPTTFGTVLPDDRHILITPKVATVVQFHNFDYGMERCVLHIDVPEHPGQDMAGVAEGSYIDIWILDRRLSDSLYRPDGPVYAAPRGSLLATFVLGHGISTTSDSFLCPSGEYTTLELTCSAASEACDVDLWQNQRAKPRRGVYMIQYSSNTMPPE